MPPPPGFLRFSDLCDHVGASPNTVRAAIARMRKADRPVPLVSGTSKLYTPEQADAVRSWHGTHGGRYPQKSVR